MLLPQHAAVLEQPATLPAATFMGFHCVMAVPPRVLHDESCPEASSTAAHTRSAECPPGLVHGLRPHEDHRGSMRPRRNSRGGTKVRRSASTPLLFSGHLLKGKGQGTDCPKPVPKLLGRDVFPPAGVIWVAAGRRGTYGGAASRPPNVPRHVKRPEGPGHARQGHAARARDRWYG